MKVLAHEIEYCSECPSAHGTDAISHKEPTCQRRLSPAKTIPDYPRIPSWCPLPDPTKETP